MKTLWERLTAVKAPGANPADAPEGAAASTAAAIWALSCCDHVEQPQFDMSQPPRDHAFVTTTQSKAAAAARIGAGLAGRKRAELLGLLRSCFARAEPWLQEKHGEATAGVKRQYMGCAGRVANGISTVHLSYVREKTGHALAGARQRIPREHIDDPVKSLVMGLPLDLAFRTRGQLAHRYLHGRVR